jgi:hypothetical protein
MNGVHQASGVDGQLRNKIKASTVNQPSEFSDVEFNSSLI